MGHFHANLDRDLQKAAAKHEARWDRKGGPSWEDRWRMRRPLLAHVSFDLAILAFLGSVEGLRVWAVDGATFSWWFVLIPAVVMAALLPVEVRAWRHLLRHYEAWKHKAEGMDASFPEELERLESLRDAGTLTEEEFKAAQARLQQQQVQGDTPAVPPAPESAPARTAWPQSPTSRPEPPSPPGGVNPRGLRTLGAWVQGLLWGAAGTSGLSAVMAVSGLATFQDWLDGTEPAAVVWDAVDVYFAFLFLVVLVAIVTAPLFITWLWRADRQASALAPNRPARYRRGWTVAGWFVPFANLVIPKQIVDDVWRRAEPTATGDGHRPSPSMEQTAEDVWSRTESPSEGHPTRIVRVPRLLHWWWGLLLAGFLTLQLSGWADPSYEAPLEAAGWFFATSALADVLLAIAGVLAVFLVRNTSHRLYERADLRISGRDAKSLHNQGRQYSERHE